MTMGERLGRWFRRTGSEILGWPLVVLGVLLIPLPGPGTLVLVTGIALLAPNYAWAQRLLDPLQRQAVQAAKYGVASWPRIIASVLGGVWLFALGIVWWVSPTIPKFDVLNVGFGPQLPGAGWATGLGLMASALAAWSLLAYSVRRWRDPEDVTSPTDRHLGGPDSFGS